MPAVCDHLLWGGPNLKAAVSSLGRRTGVKAIPGGSHPELGTHNAVAAIGRHQFLEVIAPDPTLQPGALAHQLATRQQPALLMWAARVDDAAAAAARATDEGFRAVVTDGHRVRPDGTIVSWTNVFVSEHGAGTLIPFFIAWHDGVHPSDDAPRGLRLRSLRAETPQPAALQAVLEALDVKLTVRRAAKARLVAVIDSPRGRIELTGP
ncbi:MAG TPA: VOC family protein [Candidatus Binatia bacterium]|nr:VOC family protein [Candidatus Binatia bacterium]